jgi:ATP phosphoribosyltransferase
MVPLENYDVKLLKVGRNIFPLEVLLIARLLWLLQPQNILGMLHAGTRDVGFAGRDWVEELGITDVVEILNTDMDPVRIVAAAPDVGARVSLKSLQCGFLPLLHVQMS